MSRNSSRSTSAEPRFAVGQTVCLRDPLPWAGLERGAIGAVVLVHARPRLAYEVEFVDANGQTRALVTVTPEQITSGTSHTVSPA